MKKNMSITDRWVRVFIAAAIIIAVSLEVVTGTTAIVLSVLAAIFLLTSAIRFCPLYLPFGISTKKK